MDAIATGDDGMRFGSIGGATIQRVEISDTTNDGIAFGTLDAAVIAVLNSTIAIAITGRHGLNFGSLDVGSDVRISGSTITAGSDGINFGTITDSTVLVGGATAAEGNSIAVGATGSAIDFNGAIDNSAVAVASNSSLQSTGTTQAIEFGDISNNADVVIVNNLDIAGGRSGVYVIGDIADSTLTIAGNTIAGTNDAAIRFGNSFANTISDAKVTIGSANVTVDGTPLVAGSNTLTGGGIRFVSALVDNTDVTIVDNLVGTSLARVGGDGIAFEGGIQDHATVTLDGNAVYATERAIDVVWLESPDTLDIAGGTYDGTGGALRVDNTGVAGSTNGRLDVGAATFVGGSGSTVFEVLTDAGNAGVDIDFSGSAAIDGGATGMRLSGPGIDILNDTLGSIAFANQATSYIELADGAEFLPGSPTVIDAASVTFAGLTGLAMTPAQLLATEDMITHFPDDATLGLIDISPLFVISGESIQTAVNFAGGLVGPQTVTVGGGTFGGSVEVWVDDLTLVGAGATTIIDADAVDPYDNNGDVDNGFQVAAISRASSSGDDTVTGVTIDGFAFTSSTAGSNTGVVLGEDTGVVRAAESTTIRNGSFTDLLDGIDAPLLGGTTTIDTVTMTDIARRGFNQGDTFGLGAGDAVVIQHSSITAAGNAVRFRRFLAGGSAVTLYDNTLVSTGDSAVQFAGGAGSATIAIVDNAEIRGAQDGILFDNLSSSAATYSRSAIIIAGNTDIIGESRDGIRVTDDLSNVAMTIGTATATVNGNAMAFGANGNIVGAERGINLTRGIGGNDANLTIANNTLIQGQTLDAIRFGSFISLATVGIVGNAEIRGGEDGIEIFSVTRCGPCTADNRPSLVIAGNDGIFGDGASSDGIHFLTSIFDADVTIGTATFVVDGVDTAFGGNGQIVGGDDGIDFGSLQRSATALVTGNTLIQGLTGSGIEVAGAISENSEFTVSGNTEIVGGSAGVAFLAAIDASAVTIDGNDIAGNSDGIAFAGAIGGDSTVTVSNNTRVASLVDTAGINDDAIAFEGAVSGAGTAILIADNALIEGRDRGISFDGAATVSDASVTIRGNTVTGLDLDAILFDTLLSNATVLIGGATDADGNTIVGDDEALDIDAIVGGTFTLSHNTRLAGITGDGIEFEGAISGGAAIAVTGNREISGALTGVNFESTVTDATVLIDGNGTATLNGAAYNGAAPVNLDNFVITAAISGAAGSAIAFTDAIGGASAVTISRNMITGSTYGVSFDTIGATGTTKVHNNFILDNAEDGVDFNGSVSSRVEVFQNFIADNGGDGIDVDSSASVGTGNLFVQQNFLPGSAFAHGNGDFAFNLRGTGTPNLEANWWGSTGFAAIAASLRRVDVPVTAQASGVDTNIPAAPGATGLNPFAFQNNLVFTIERPTTPPDVDPSDLDFSIPDQTDPASVPGDVASGRAGLDSTETSENIFANPYNLFGESDLAELSPAAGGQSCQLVPIEGGLRLTCEASGGDANEAAPSDDEDFGALSPGAGGTPAPAPNVPGLDPGLTLEDLLNMWLFNFGTPLDTAPEAL
ncbi:MAG: hypothetical protein R3F55_24645, partial [Alphaproteobacteria bacterium]